MTASCTDSQPISLSLSLSLSLCVCVCVCVCVCLRHWLTSSYILFAVPYFVYDIYAMFLCHWYKLQVKGHEVDNGSRCRAVAVSGYLRREFLMILHHVVMVTVCFPVSVVSVFTLCVSERVFIFTSAASLSVLEAEGRLLPGRHVPG